jgi:hypothetical protein
MYRRGIHYGEGNTRGMGTSGLRESVQGQNPTGPIHGGLETDTWGADAVRPRDIQNGIEDPDWSYWGGKAHGFTDDHFAGKLLGKTSDGEILLGYVRLPDASF